MATSTCAALCSKKSINLSILSNTSLNVLYRSIQTSSQDNFPKYHHVKKKIRLHKEKLDGQKLKYERLDIEDRPSGCLLCPHRNPDVEIDYKNVRLLSQFVSPHTGKIYGRRITGLCDRKQVELTKAIQRARKIGLMPITMKYFDFHGDPKLF